MTFPDKRAPKEFDAEDGGINVYANADRSKFVKVITGSLDAATLWTAKYGEAIPSDVDVLDPRTTFADVIPHEGRPLTDTEWEIVQEECRGGDLTLDMLWFIVEGLGWKPGQPVGREHPDWELIWKRETDCTGYIDIVYGLLRMPNLISIEERRAGWMRHGWTLG